MSSLEVNYLTSAGRVQIDAPVVRRASQASWNQLKRQLQTFLATGVDVGSSFECTLYDAAMGIQALKKIALDAGLILSCDVSFETAVLEISSVARKAGELFRNPAMDSPSWDETLENEFETLAWNHTNRVLKAEQKRDIAKLLTLNSGAIFSVPGSGKTTVALALHQILKSRSQVSHLLVLAPRNAFGAWNEAIQDCLTGQQTKFTRLEGSGSIGDALDANPQYSIISYQQAIRLGSFTLERFAESRKLHVILDESHRIKRGYGTYGANGRYAKAAFDLSVCATRREILSGTPMPQGIEDLTPQLEFLYPTAPFAKVVPSLVQNPSVFKRFYVRTTYKELKLPDPVVKRFPHNMHIEQASLYAYLVSDIAQSRDRGIDSGLQIKRGVQRLMQVAMDPKLAARSILRSDEVNGELQDLCEAVAKGPRGARLDAVIQEARDFAASGKKVVIWSPFVETVDLIHDALRDLGSQRLYGKPLLDDDEVEAILREEVVRRFKEDSHRFVLVANPAAGGEGISLHTACQHAIYAGRSYDAAHWLQSRDRINRLGMPANTTATINVHVSSPPQDMFSIDSHIQERLATKVGVMAEALDDETLRSISLEFDDQELFPGMFSLADIVDFLNKL